MSNNLSNKRVDRVSAQWGSRQVQSGHDEGTLFGYARVSTEEQKLDLQMDALTAAGVDPGNIFVEKTSGVSKRRPALALCRRALRQGDTLVVWKLDRLSRSLGWIIVFMDDLFKAGIKFRSLTEAIETATPQGRLLMHMLGAMAEFERAMIASRTSAGIKASMERGNPYGRKVTVDLEKAAKLIASGKSVAETARIMGRRRNVIAYHFSDEEVARIRAARKRVPRKAAKKTKRKR